MSGKPMKAAAGALALGALGALGLKKLKEKKGIGMGLASKLAEKKKEILGRSKGGGADTGKKGEMKSKLGVMSNKVKRVNEMLKKQRPKLQAPERKPMKPLKAMGGGMMNKPMGYKKGTMIMARGCKLGRKKATKIT